MLPISPISHSPDQSAASASLADQRRSLWNRAWMGAAIAVMALACTAPSLAAVLAGWDVHGLTGGAGNFGASPLAVTTSDANLTVGGLTRGTGVSTSGTAAARGWGGVDWQNTSAATAVAGNDYATFTVTANSGYQVSYSSISKLDYRRSTTGASNGVLQYQIGSGTFTDIATIGYTATASSGGSISAIDLSGISALQNVPASTPVTFRIANYGGTSSGGTWYVYDVANSTANDLEISGTVSVGSSVTNGACGSANNQTFAAAPTTNLCSAGNASAVTGAGPWAWTCASTNGGSTASCSANKSAGGPFTIFHMNDIHARVTPHDWVIPAHGSQPATFEKVGGAAYVAGEMLSLVGGNPTALVLDGGDISEGNPVGDMNGTSTTSYGNGGLTGFLSIMANKIKNVSGRPAGRGIDALVVGNHDVRDISYIQNMEQMHIDGGIPVISANVRDIGTACTSSHPRYPSCEHFPATTTVTVNGTKIGIVGYTTPSAVVGASLASTLNVVQCDWKGSIASGCHIADYVNDLRNNQHCDVVILLTHDGHSDLVDPTTPVIADTADAKVPEIAVTGHWHTWAETVWQPVALNYKTIFTESASYMKYIGELNVDAAGKYVNSTQHVLRNADLTPDPDVATYVNNLIATYDANTTGHKVNDVVGYTNDALMLDDVMKWWSADEYPWSGNNTAGQWITDAMQWKCAQLFGACDLAIEAGGGVRADIPAGPVTWKQVYETFPWADDTYYRINMTGQDIVNFLNKTNLDAGFSSQLDVTANDGIITSIKFNGQPLNLSQTYTVAINNYMYANPPSGYVWTDTNPLTSSVLVRESLADYMTAVHGTPATAYNVGGNRYHFNGNYSGGYRAVVTMMNDADSKLTFEDAFIRFLSANPETLARRGSKQVPSDLVNTDGSVNVGNRLAEQELYRSYMGFKTGALKPGDIVEVWGKAAFYGGNPEFVDQEGVYGDGIEFKIVGHDDSLAKPALVSSIGALLNDNYKNHYVRILAKKSATANSVTDQNGVTLKLWDKTGYAAMTIPGNVGDTLEVTGVLTMENFGFRLRSDNAVVTTAALPAATSVSSHVDPLQPEVSAPITLSATAAISGGGYVLTPVADTQVVSGSPTTNYGTSNNIYLQSSSTSSYGNERGWLKFDLSSIPAGATITGASLQLWNWKATGAALPVEVRSANDDSWTETGLNWNNQPAPGSVLATQTLATGTSSVWYNWDVTSFVQGEFNGDKTASLMLKPVTEGSADATAPSYGFDAKEYGSNAPVLVVTTSATASSVSNVKFFYRYSANNTSWGAWTQTGANDTAAPYNASFSFPNGAGYYEFYSVATDNLGGVESTPAYAQSAVHYQAATGSTQTVSFAQPAPVQAGTVFSVTASASSTLPVVISSQTSSICTVTGTVVTTVAPGNCTLAASQAGDAGYWLPASTSQTFSVTAIAQAISFGSAPVISVGGNGMVSATGGASGNPVTFSSQTPGICSIVGNTVTGVAAGTCTIAANQAGAGNYAAAPTVTQNINVTAATVGGNDGDVPLPAWAMALLALGLLEVMRRQMNKRQVWR